MQYYKKLNFLLAIGITFLPKQFICKTIFLTCIAKLKNFKPFTRYTSLLPNTLKPRIFFNVQSFFLVPPLP